MLTIHPLEIPFRQTFSHATATRSCTESVLVKVESLNGIIGVGEGCPRKYVTGETIHSSLEFFEKYRERWKQFKTLEDLKAWMGSHSQAIDENPSSWCAVELALLDRWGQEQSQSIESLLTLQELTGEFQYSAVLGTENVGTFEKQAQQFAALGFYDFKVKVSGDLANDRKKIEFLKHLSIQSFRLRLDVNNLWSTAAEAVTYLKSLEFPFFAIEEPLQVGDYQCCGQISRQLKVPIILDESFLRMEQFEFLIDDPQLWIINVRISKMGGIMRSLAIAKQAQLIGIPIIIGAQVGETSILTRAALTVANHSRDNLLAQEGAFGTYLLEHDITDTSLMFGKGGRLSSESLSGRFGFGLNLAAMI